MSKLNTQSYKCLHILGLFFSLVFLLGLAACRQKESTEPQKDIIGKWQSQDGTLTLEFTAEDKVHSIYMSGGIGHEIKSDTIFTDDTHIVGVWERSIQVQTWEVHIRGDQMTLIGEDGTQLKFHRIE